MPSGRNARLPKSSHTIRTGLLITLERLVTGIGCAKLLVCVELPENGVQSEETLGSWDTCALRIAVSRGSSVSFPLMLTPFVLGTSRCKSNCYAVYCISGENNAIIQHSLLSDFRCHPLQKVLTSGTGEEGGHRQGGGIIACRHRLTLLLTKSHAADDAASISSVSQSEQSEPLARGPNECQIVDNEPLLLPLVMPPMPQAATRDYATNVMGRDRRGRHSGRIPDPWLQGSKGCIP